MKFMKTNGTRILLIALFLYIFLVIISFSVDAQPDYNFSSVSLISGTDKLVGATYRFVNVRPGVDAIVTTTDITGGITLNQIDGGSGFIEAFQPVIDAPAFSRGYAEFTIDFVDAGTFDLRIMNEVPVTCIDVDGRMHDALPVYEFDMVKKSPGTYADFNMLGGELAITFDATWITGTNVVAVDYPGVDTMAKQAMFSTVSANVNTITIRVGADNQTSGAVQRLRSVYFKKFTYFNSFLSKSDLLSFRGLEKNKKVELQWSLQSSNKIESVVIEKSKGSAAFKAIGEVAVNGELSNAKEYKFTDIEMLDGNALYRLKLTAVNGKVEYSNILSFRNSNQTGTSFKIYPSAIKSSATMNVQSASSGTGLFELVDYSGRVIHRQNVAVQAGLNNIQLNSMTNVTGGNYVAVLKMENNIYTQKILKQ